MLSKSKDTFEHKDMYPRIHENTSHMTFFLAKSSVSDIHLLVIAGDYFLISPLPDTQKDRKHPSLLSSHPIPLLEGPKIDLFSKHQSHHGKAAHQGRSGNEQGGNSLFLWLHLPVLKHCIHQWKIILESML